MDNPTDDAKRAQEAKERAKSYMQAEAQAADDDRRAGPRQESDWAGIVGQRIELAMREGVFDNLPGRGQPLNLNEDPFASDDQQMAFKLLENNDLKPAWISERNVILSEIEQLRNTFAATTRHYRRELSQTTELAEQERLSSSWTNQINRWAAEIADLNKRIETLNLQQPIAQLEIIKLRLDDELAKVGASRHLK